MLSVGWNAMNNIGVESYLGHTQKFDALSQTAGTR